ncbi:MAG: hypothetical protein KUG53_01675 [Pseudomonadales bacterium]|nr:hypothetical protein [Pseudomonadales bacterium]
MNHVASTSFLPPWLKTTLVGIGAVLLLLFMCLFVAITVVQKYPAKLIPFVENLTGQLLDRELEIGELNQIELNREIYLVAHDVVLSNPEWADTPDFARVGTLRIRIDLPSILWEGPIVINELELNNAALTLLAPEKHPPNWDFWPNEEKQQPQHSSSVFPVLIPYGKISNSTIVYRDSDQNMLVSIDQLELQGMPDASLVNLNISGKINEIPLSVQGHLGPTIALLTQQDLSMELAVQWGQLTVKSSGTIGDLPSLSGVNMQLKMTMPNARSLLDLLGIPEVRDGPLYLVGDINDADTGMVFKIDGTLDKFDLHLSGTVENPQLLDGVDVAFNLSGPSLIEMGAIFNLEGLPEIPFKVSGEFARKDTVLEIIHGDISAGQGNIKLDGRLPNYPEIEGLELTLAGSNFDLSIFGELAGIENLPSDLYDIKGRFTAKDEGVELTELQIDSHQSHLRLSGMIGLAPDNMGTRLNVNLSGKSLASLGGWVGVQTLATQKFQISGELMRNEVGWRLNDALFDSAGVKLNLQGTVDSLKDPTHLAIVFKLESLDLSTALQSYGFGVDGLPAFPLEINGRVSGPPDGLKIDKMTADSGESHLDISGMLGDPATLQKLDLVVALSTPDILTLVPVVADRSLPRLPVSTSGTVKISQKGIGISDFKGTAAGARMLLDGFVNHVPPYNGSHISLSTEGPNLRLVLEPWVSHDIANTPFQLSLNAGFESGGMRVEKFEVRLSDAHLTAQFVADSIDELSSLSGKIKLTGSSSHQLNKLLGSDAVFPDADYNLDVVIENRSESIRLKPVSLNWGKNNLTGTVDIKPGDIPVVHADLHSQFVDLAFLLPDVEILQKEKAVRAVAGNTTQKPDLSEELTTSELSDRVIPDEPLNFSWLQKVEGAIKYKADEIFLHDEGSSSVVVDLSIEKGVLSARKFSVDGTALIGDAMFTVKPLDEGADIDLYLDLKRAPLVLLLGGNPEYQADSIYRAKIRAHGSSLREIAKNSNGALVFKGGGGRLEATGLGLILGDMFQEMLDKINPFSTNEPYTQLICHAGAMFVKNGELMVAPGVVVRTEKIDFAFDGKIDLHNEKMNMNFSTRSRTGLGVSASKAVTPYFKIGGTLAHPRLALNTKGAVVSGGAAVATAGLSILAEGMWDRWVVTSQNPCERLIAKYRAQDESDYQLLLPASQ